MTNAEREIEEIVHRETRAWDRKDADLLLTVFHPDMVWPWPPDARSHDPALWVMELGRFDAERWRRSWQELFDTHALVHNQRRLIDGEERRHRRERLLGKRRGGEKDDDG